jgi:hypothetical protein
LSLCLTNEALHHEDVCGNGCIDPRIFYLRAKLEVSGQLHVSAALPRGSSPAYAMDRRLDVPQNRYGRQGEEKIFFPYWDSNSNFLAVQHVTRVNTD